MNVRADRQKILLVLAKKDNEKVVWVFANRDVQAFDSILYRNEVYSVRGLDPYTKKPVVSSYSDSGYTKNGRVYATLSKDQQYVNVYELNGYFLKRFDAQEIGDIQPLSFDGKNLVYEVENQQGKFVIFTGPNTWKMIDVESFNKDEYGVDDEFVRYAQNEYGQIPVPVGQDTWYLADSTLGKYEHQVVFSDSGWMMQLSGEEDIQVDGEYRKYTLNFLKPALSARYQKEIEIPAWCGHPRLGFVYFQVKVFCIYYAVDMIRGFVNVYATSFYPSESSFLDAGTETQRVVHGKQIVDISLQELKRAWERETDAETQTSALMDLIDFNFRREGPTEKTPVSLFQVNSAQVALADFEKQKVTVYPYQHFFKGEIQPKRDSTFTLDCPVNITNTSEILWAVEYYNEKGRIKSLHWPDSNYEVDEMRSLNTLPSKEELLRLMAQPTPLREETTFNYWKGSWVPVETIRQNTQKKRSYRQATQNIENLLKKNFQDADRVETYLSLLTGFERVDEVPVDYLDDEGPDGDRLRRVVYYDNMLSLDFDYGVKFFDMVKNSIEERQRRSLVILDDDSDVEDLPGSNFQTRSE